MNYGCTLNLSIRKIGKYIRPALRVQGLFFCFHMVSLKDTEDNMKKTKMWWFLTIGWCAFIFYQSGRDAVQSSWESRNLTIFINYIIFKITGLNETVLSELVVRTCAHFLEYLVLGFLLYNSFRDKRRVIQSLTLSFAAGLLYAATDEIHQYFVPGRSPRITDVGIDWLGVLAGSTLTCVAAFLKNRFSQY